MQTTKHNFKKQFFVFFSIALFCCFNVAKAQTDSLQQVVMALPADKGFDKTFTKCEHPPTFIGGLDGWRTFLEANLKYPEKAQEHGTQGIVRVQLVVDKNGKVREVIALNDPGDGLGKEAERVVKKSNKWIPATQNNIRVNYRFVQTITFQLQ